MDASKYAGICWTVEDVIENAKGAGITITRGRAEKLLRDLESEVADAMVEAGWEVIERRVKSSN